MGIERAWQVEIDDLYFIKRRKEDNAIVVNATHTHEISSLSLSDHNLSDRVAASNLSIMISRHLSAFVMLPSSKLSTKPGYVAPA